MELTLAAARTVVLAAQGLLEPPRKPAQKVDVLAAIRCMAALQIDSISVVARSHYLVLWSRLGSFEPRWLDELLVEGAIFEYWSHAASFLPIEDYPLYRRQMLDEHRRSRAWLVEHPEVVEKVMGHIRDEGAVRSAHFPRTSGRSSGWWDWKPEKEALERLFAVGELMVPRREKFQRVYDLRERVLPEWDDRRTPTAEEARRELALKAVRALGLAPARWVPGYFYTAKKGVARLLEELAADGALAQVRIAAWDDPAYIHPDNLPLAEQAAAGALRPTRMTFLSPFDPLVWDRARLMDLFGFDYHIETYTPAAKRRYGYYTLPILHRGALIGRLDPKSHRRAGVFEVRALHLEPGVVATAELATDIAAVLSDCATWHGTPEVVIRATDPPEMAGLLTEALAADRTMLPSPKMARQGVKTVL